MKQFSELFTTLDQTTKTLPKVAALADYFQKADDPDKLWTVALLSGRRPKRSISTANMREWAAESAGIPDWLFQDSYHVVGDLGETIALLLPPPAQTSEQPLHQWMESIKAIRTAEEEEKRDFVLNSWNQLETQERFLFNKLVAGSFRVGVSQKLMVRALAKAFEIEENVLAHRLMGNWTPDNTTFSDLVLEKGADEHLSRPYPFYLAYPLEDDPQTLGEVTNWQIERKWDGIRGQLIVRKGESFLWSRGEELVTEKFPELASLVESLPDGTVIDGEILAYDKGSPLNFNQLQTRIGRKNLTKSILKKAPVVLMAYDLLEAEGKDLRQLPLAERREQLERICQQAQSQQLLLSPVLAPANWQEVAQLREKSREFLSEGLMLKRYSSTYQVGRKRGDWWKWKVAPLVIDAVMIYAMRGHGRRANLYTDYTFAVWDGQGGLLPFTKAYSGLTDAEIRQVDSFVKKNTIERFGPVRSVQPTLVFEIAFEGIAKSSRHKSGVALRFPRINRWRTDKPAEEANTMADLESMLLAYGG